MERRGKQGLKKGILLITIILFLSGCSNNNNEINFPIGASPMEEITNSIPIIMEESILEEPSVNEIILNGSVGLIFDSHGDGTCTVRKGTCTDKNVIIPTKSPSGDRVTTIGSHTWASDRNIESIYIPEGVITIEKTVFYDTAIKSVHLPSSIKNIEYAAFANLCGVYRVQVTFAGSEDQWAKIDIANYNQSITIYAEMQFLNWELQ